MNSVSSAFEIVLTVGSRRSNVASASERTGSRRLLDHRADRKRQRHMTAPILFSSATDEWPTPRDFFAKLNRHYQFTLDPCATPENATCPLYFTKEQDGLAQDWGTHRVFCNPPLGRALGAWARKCFQASQGGALVALFVPARTCTRWFHDYVYGKAAIRFYRGRFKFGNADTSAPFSSMLAVYGDDRLPAECKRCGELFEAKRSDARACSNACRQALHRQSAQKSVTLIA
jgi:site-specific DNA-methyltransferase (adenine-specific)